MRNALSALPLPAPVYRSDSISSSTSDSLFADARDARSSTAAFSRIETIFSSLGCLAASCLSDGHFKTGREEHGVDLDHARDLQQELFRLLNAKQLSRLIYRLFERVLDPARNNYPSVECLRGFVVLLVSDLLNIPRHAPGMGPPTSLSSTASGRSEGSGPGSGASGFPSQSTDAMDVGDEGPYVVLRAMVSPPTMILNAFAAAINKLEQAPSKILEDGPTPTD
ncbi:unnamed protein product [Echinostoma caproni]|uniref:DUF913 domain-containing protein n=1 Tax=Echinostoma caproni TaxID=27848 RepID=A0A183B1B4_9TREM|nr:unnamed protein product [Echinostoma caproni]